MKINNFALIIGAMKCGTSSLFEYLSQHPEIAPCRQKEPHFFSKDENFSQGFDYYQSLWNWNPPVHKIALEATPGYTKVTHNNSANAAKNIALTQVQQQVNFKLIYLMRNPIERIESQCIHDATKRNQAGEGVISKVDQRVVDASKYARQISEFYYRFPSHDILLLNFDDLKNDPEQLLIKVCQFLGIDSEYEFQRTRVIHNSRQRRRVAIPFWQNIRRTAWLTMLRSKVSPQQKNLFKQVFGKEKNISLKLDPCLAEDLSQELKPDLMELQNKYKFDFQSWQLDL